MTNDQPSGSAEFSYAYKTSVVGPGWGFRLTHDGIEWTKGRHFGEVPYAKIRRVRMTYRPVTTQGHRFVTEIWSPGVPKLTISSTSWKSLMEQERFDRSYAEFIREIHRRIGAAGTPVMFQGGLPAPVYWAGLAGFVLVSLGLVGLMLRSAMAGAWSGAAIVALFLAFFLWNGNFFRRNRPVVYRPDAPPPDLLPAA
ncbi:MAG: hypothetical protein JO254_03450 [Pseudolabrys sp.]|nr:hypothetical protein [Pseudolabrys sp.]